MNRKILVIRFSSLGDVVLTTALLPNLKAKWPDCEIDVVTKDAYASVYENNPYINHVLTFNPRTSAGFSDVAKRIRKNKYDLIFDLQWNLRSWFLRVVASPPLAVVVENLAWARRRLVLLKRISPLLKHSVRDRILHCLKRVDIPVINSETQLFPQFADKVLEKYSIPSHHTLIGVAPGAKHKTKCWPVDRFVKAINQWGQASHTTVLLLGSEHDQELGRAIAAQLKVPFLNLIGQTTLSELVSVVSHLQFLLTNDSGLLHVGEALKIPLVAIFGPTVREFGFAPYRPTSRMVEVSGLTCRPCSLHGDDVCPLQHHKCMEDIDLKAVFFAADEVWGSKSDKMDVGLSTL